MQCLKCARGLHELCETSCATCHPVENEVTTISYKQDEEPDEEFNEDIPADFHGHKLDSSLKDQQSTGRKRAAKAYPLDRDAPCEWIGIKQPGGSAIELPDCINGKQQCRHHGPDYNTLNNDEGNVHRICHSHHNYWHAANDLLKDEAYLKQYGHKVDKSNLSQAAKELRSGKVN